jgi:solute:Na+ symporter, SSS family
VNLHLALLLGYSTLLIGLGLWLGRRVEGSDDFFVAGRRLGPGLLFSTLLAANIGAGSTVNAAGLGFRDGLSAWWWVGSAGIGSLILAFTVGPRIRRLAADHDLHTVGDFLEWRYHPGVRGLIAALLWLGTLAILAGQLIAGSRVLEAVAGLDKTTGCLIGGVVMTTYFAAGGLLGSAWVNLVQLVVLLGGLVLALPLVLSRAGGMAAVAAATPSDAGYWSLLSGGESGIVYLAMLMPAFIVSPGILQKIYGGRDDRAVRLGVAANGVVLLFFAFVPVLCGMAARALHPDLPSRELALPTLLVADVPLLVGSLGLAAVFSAEVSSADAILFMLATSLSQDLYKRFIDPRASDLRLLRVARFAALVGGACGVGVALLAETIYQVLSIFYTLLSVSLFVPVVVGVYARRFGTPEAVAGILAGVSVVASARLWPSGLGLTPALQGLVASIAAALLVALLRGRRPRDVAGGGGA